MYILSIDLGKHLAAALLEDDELINMYYQKKECFREDDICDLIEDLTEFCEDSGVDPEEVTLVIEVPSHRYFGKANATPILKIMHQAIHLIMNMRDRVNELIIVFAPEWNQQRNDTEKREEFMDRFHYYDLLPYYQEKHMGASNAHERDATLLGEYVYNNYEQYTNTD